MPVAALVAIGFAAGCALAPLLGDPVWGAVAVALLLTVVLGALIFFQRGPRLTLLLLAALCAGLAARGAQRADQLALVHTLEADLTERIYLGEVRADSGAPLEHRELLVATAIDVAGRQRPALVLLRLHGLPAAWPRFEPGARVQFRTRLVPPVPAWQPGQFDFRSLWLARGVIARGNIARPAQLVAVSTEVPAWRIGIGLARLRQALGAAVDRALPDEAAALTRAMVLGDRSDVTREQRAVFDGAGTGHLLAVSGLHVGAFAGLMFALCSLLCRRWEWLSRRIAPRRLAALCAAPSGLLFALVAGASPSALRAGIMSLAVCIGIAVWRERATVSALGLAALVLLGLSPAAVDDVSF
ncbi:MAG: ComEC/Rec2 family competence protein, partial [Deltaproteobacteria bacterium]|nr:ComEC/Rec2 family competence protein [Deltaproteobacteria bacterium]